MRLSEQNLHQLPPARRRLCFTVDHRQDGYAAEGRLTLAWETAAVRIDAPVADYRAAIEQRADKLAEEIRRQTRHPLLERRMGTVKMPSDPGVGVGLGIAAEVLAGRRHRPARRRCTGAPRRRCHRLEGDPS